MSDLATKTKGKEYDEAYIEHEISVHKKILDEVNDALGRNQTSGDWSNASSAGSLRALMDKARTLLQANLTAAEELEKKFGV